MTNPRLIDNHAHLNFSAFDSDRTAVIDRALVENIWVINVGTNQTTSLKAVEIADQYEQGVYAIVGLHPVHTTSSFHDEAELGEGGQAITSRGEGFDADFYRPLLTNPKVVGIGECGLDYFRLAEDSLALQRDNFAKQVVLAGEFDKPLMLHIRPGQNTEGSPYFDAIEMIKAQSVNSRGNVHFFAGSEIEAKAFLDLGFNISFTGVITFAKEYHKLVAYVPLDRILLETDCPYVTPVPFRGGRNEPSYVSKVAEQIAVIKQVDITEVASVTTANSRRLFNI